MTRQKSDLPAILKFQIVESGIFKAVFDIKKLIYDTVLPVINELLKPFQVAGVQGFEPQLTDPESAVLPLNDTPRHLSFVSSIIPQVLSVVKPFLGENSLLSIFLSSLATQ